MTITCTNCGHKQYLVNDEEVRETERCSECGAVDSLKEIP